MTVKHFQLIQQVLACINIFRLCGKSYNLHSLFQVNHALVYAVGHSFIFIFWSLRSPPPASAVCSAWPSVICQIKLRWVSPPLPTVAGWGIVDTSRTWSHLACLRPPCQLNPASSILCFVATEWICRVFYVAMATLACISNLQGSSFWIFCHQCAILVS